MGKKYTVNQAALHLFIACNEHQAKRKKTFTVVDRHMIRILLKDLTNTPGWDVDLRGKP
jgi:hypothetical protein